MTGRSEANTGCDCKIGRVASSYELSVDSELQNRWTGGERESTRTLADWFNKRVLESALSAAGVQTRDGEIENTYRLLTADDVTSGTRVETRNALERDGVPIEAVESDFVSHQTVHSHLTDCLSASLSESTPAERLDDAATTLGQLTSRTEAVTTDTITRLDNHDALDIGSFEVLVSLRVNCTDCHQQYTARELLERGGCDCDD